MSRKTPGDVRHASLIILDAKSLVLCFGIWYVSNSSGSVRGGSLPVRGQEGYFSLLLVGGRAGGGGLLLFVALFSIRSTYTVSHYLNSNIAWSVKSSYATLSYYAETL